MEKEKVLITGAAGFLGHRLISRVREAGAEAFPIVRSSYDLCHEAEAALAVLGSKPTHIIHTAFHWGPPGVAFRDNMVIGMNVVHSAAVNRSRIILPQIYYGALPWERDGQVDVDAGCDAQDALERMCEAYDRQYELDCALVRLPTLYGPSSPRPDPVSLVATAILQAHLKSSSECVIPFCPTELFTLLYVEDAAEALTKIALSGAEGPCRLKPIASVSMGKIIETVVKLVGFTGKVNVQEKPTSTEMRAMPETDDVNEVELPTETGIELGIDLVLKAMGAKTGNQEVPEAPQKPSKPSGRSRRPRRPRTASPASGTAP